MKALTLWPEWAWAVTHLGKDVENRSWVIPPGLYALHAGVRFNGHGLKIKDRKAGRESVIQTMRKWCLPYLFEKAANTDPNTIVSGAIVGVIRVTRHTDCRGWCPQNGHTGWAAPGQIANHIELVSVLPTPIPCKGALGLWTVPDNITHQLETVCLPD